MGTHYKGRDEEARALDTYIKLMRAAGSITANVHVHLADKGLTISQFGTLEILHHLGPLSQKEIGKKLLKSGGNITMVIDNLEKRGLVRRERGPEDRRFITVHLTEDGRRLIREMFPRHVEAVVREMEILDPAEQVELARLCRKLGLQEREQPKED